MAERFIIPVEFSKSNIDDLKLFATLKEFSHPGGIIKDILKQKLPISILNQEEKNGDMLDS